MYACTDAYRTAVVAMHVMHVIVVDRVLKKPPIAALGRDVVSLSDKRLDYIRIECTICTLLDGESWEALILVIMAGKSCFRIPSFPVSIAFRLHLFFNCFILLF